LPASDKRFARQHCYLPPPELLRASQCTGKDHHLSGLNRHTWGRARGLEPEPSRGCGSGASPATWPAHDLVAVGFGLNTLSLACPLNSLVRVSRRVTLGTPGPDSRIALHAPPVAPAPGTQVLLRPGETGRRPKERGRAAVVDGLGSQSPSAQGHQELLNPMRGAFHLSLTLLVRYRSPGSI